MINKEILDYYKQTSVYTDLDLYKDFAIGLPDNISKLCFLQRKQIIHPFDLLNEEEKNNENSFYGDMTKVPKTSLYYENELYPTAIAIISGLLIKDKNYSIDRRIEDKIHVCCREQSILLASILKAKGYSARVRSGFAKYVNTQGIQAGDHWVTEYYNTSEKRWIMVDADMYYDQKTLDKYHINFNLLDVPHEKFIFGAQAYLGLRENKYQDNDIYYASSPYSHGLKAALRALFYDFHSLMNNEITFLHTPKYIVDENFELTEEEYIELDNLANLLLNPDLNFKKIKEIWNNNEKFRILSSGMN